MPSAEPTNDGSASVCTSRARYLRCLNQLSRAPDANLATRPARWISVARLMAPSEAMIPCPDLFGCAPQLFQLPPLLGRQNRSPITLDAPRAALQVFSIRHPTFRRDVIRASRLICGINTSPVNRAEPGNTAGSASAARAGDDHAIVQGFQSCEISPKHANMKACFGEISLVCLARTICRARS